ncbi:MAG TPA: hypothetical protein VFM88_19005 [Vicinamibacteria bacterium]|nr:hypothetical protein [Vicinamibacteria bacterium]
MIEALRLSVFLGFVWLGLRLWTEDTGARRRHRVNALIAYVATASVIAGVLQRDAWPFTSHTIAVGRARADSLVCQTRLVGVDVKGAEWRLDPYSFTPVFDSILQYWLEQALDQLAADRRERALGFLLQRAEASRERLASGRSLGPQRLLGPAAAPYWLLLPRQPAASLEPYVGLRGYRACWRTDAPAPSAREQGRLIFEYRRR